MTLDVKRVEDSLPDAPARLRIDSDLATTLFVEAAAGTGKTTALVGRIISILRSGAGALDKIVAVTFTEKAAGEMKLRLRTEIERARSAETVGSPARSHLDDALEKLEVARIGTIHAFCGDLLRERPVEAGVDPLFEVAPEQETDLLLDRAFDSWFQRILADPPEGVRRVLRRRPRGFNAMGPRQQLRNAARSLIEHRDFTAAWRRESFDRPQRIDHVVEQLEGLAVLADQATQRDDWLARNFQNIRDFLGENQLREAVRGRDYDALESGLRELARSRPTGWHWRGRGSYGPEHSRAELIEKRDAVKQQLDDLLEAADADLAPCLREELRPIVDEYELLKQRAGILDFLDLMLRARDLIRQNHSVRAELQRRFSHYFVDEFQDTDPLQAELLLLLAADRPELTDASQIAPIPGKLFLVGDPKQAVYRFRRADVATYEVMKRRLVSQGAAVLHLTTSFRAVPSIQHAVNAAFAPVMGREAVGTDDIEPDDIQTQYVPLQHSREEFAGQPTIVALPAPRPYGDFGRIVSWKLEESLSDAVGGFVDWLIRCSGWTVDGPAEGGRIPIEARHVCILFRRFKSFRDDVTRPYVRALEARRVPHVLVGGHSFHDREEVLALRNALCAIEWPDDELRVFATLRGPFFALGDDALLSFRHKVRSLHPMRPLGEFDLDTAQTEVADALGILARLHMSRNYTPAADTVSRLLSAVRAHAGIAIWPTGEQALANCLRMADIARRFERRGSVSFRAFVEHLEDGAERGDAQDAPVVEEGTEGVRIMTAHRAKGLEFPVVILADPNCRATRELPGRFVDSERGVWAEPLCGSAPWDLLDHRDEEIERDRAEAVRLTYVAATRARDLLVVPVVGDEYTRDSPGWLEVLDPVIYPERARKRDAGSAPGCPAFGSDSVFERPSSARAGSRSSVAPGLHVPRAGEHDVVWWDPAALELDCKEEVGLRQQRILEADEEGVVAEEGIRDHERWQRRRTDALEAGERPSIAVLSVTELAHAETPERATDAAEVALEIPVDVEQVIVDRSNRPSGKRFGTLVHATLAVVDLGADERRVHAAAVTEGRLLGACANEVEAAVATTLAALAHPLLRRAAAADQLRRETPVSLLRDDGILVEGVVDLAFRELTGPTPHWTVVDFKTDRDLAPNLSQYGVQLRLYAAAISQATAEPATPILLSL